MTVNTRMQELALKELTVPDIERRIEPPGQFRLLRYLAPGALETMQENLGLRGYADLIRYLWQEQVFDRRYGVRTEYLVPPEQLGFADAAAQAEASRYRATPPFCVATSLNRLRERLGDLGGHMMVDYGSGAGRVMILGAEAGIGRVAGLELSPALAEQCRENLRRYAARFGVDTRFEVLVEDATRYAPPPEATIFYFFNPFSAAFFHRAVEGIRASVRAHPRDIWLLTFQTWRYPPVGLDLAGAATGVQTWTNAAAPERFLAP